MDSSQPPKKSGVSTPSICAKRPTLEGRGAEIIKDLLHLAGVIHGHLDGVRGLVLIHLQRPAFRRSAVELGEDPAVPDAPLRVLGLWKQWKSPVF